MVKRYRGETTEDQECGAYVLFTEYQQLEEALTEAETGIDILRGELGRTGKVPELLNDHFMVIKLRAELDASNKLADQIREALTDAYAVNGFGKLKDRIQELEKERDELDKFNEALREQNTALNDGCLEYEKQIDKLSQSNDAMAKANDAMREALKKIYDATFLGIDHFSKEWLEAAIQKEVK